MSLSPLAERIYQTLLRQCHLPNPLISMVIGSGAVGIHATSRLGPEAERSAVVRGIGEICACQSSKPPMPILTSIVVRRSADGTLGTPGAGYFAVGFPQVRDETARIEMWREEVRRVVAFSYPNEPTPPVVARPMEPRAEAQSMKYGQSIVPSPAVVRPMEPRERRRRLREPAVIAALIGLLGTLLTLIVTVWLSTRHGEPAQPRQADGPVRGIIIQPIPKAPQPPQPIPPAQKNAPKVLTLDGILDVLERHHQRATYGAVAGILGLDDPTSLFKDYVRSPRTAWVVNKATGLPTGTKESEYPAGLLEKKHVIDTPKELGAWLQEPD